ncbi:hypothetical protein [Burkholderia sp. KBS0801]|uniref:hypothetical protein n=1 Tax=Burkholderia sp. KBS0801 TaxID=1179675 RepID=UPI001643D3C3|nr:hypothetical protein [Burkholderia sp. KBS0801]
MGLTLLFRETQISRTNDSNRLRIQPIDATHLRQHPTMLIGSTINLVDECDVSPLWKYQVKLIVRRCEKCHKHNFLRRQ